MLPFGRHAYRPFMVRISGQTIGQRIRISLSEGENVKCSVSRRPGLPNASPQSKPLFRTSSLSNATASDVASTGSSGKPHLTSGGNALHPHERWSARDELRVSQPNCEHQVLSKPRTRPEPSIGCENRVECPDFRR